MPAGGSTGLAGAAGSAGQAGTGTPDSCSFEIDAALSPAMPTVGVVHWSTDLEGLNGANIEFTLDDPAPDEINRGSGGAIDISGQTHRALLLGLKPERSYTYRIVARNDKTVCTSADRSLTTGIAAVTTTGAAITVGVTRAQTAPDAPAPAQGFIVTTNYMSSAACIIDTDGDIVWWGKRMPDSRSPTSRARMDWEGANVWTLAANGFTRGYSNGTGEVRRISMDGTEVLNHVAGLEDAHHDLTVLPGGIVAALVYAGDKNAAASDIVERAPDGTLKVVARIDQNVFAGGDTFHANSLSYHPEDNTYTVGDLHAAGYATLTRDGKPLWQFRAGCPSAAESKCAAGDVGNNHGHHLLADGRFLVFKARRPSLVHEYQLTESASSLSASKLWSYEPGDAGTDILGDVQRLPNGNTLVVYSQDGVIREVSPAGAVVQTIGRDPGDLTSQFGYADFRQTLYGPPLR
jgi:hypothetical protein